MFSGYLFAFATMVAFVTFPFKDIAYGSQPYNEANAIQLTSFKVIVY